MRVAAASLFLSAAAIVAGVLLAPWPRVEARDFGVMGQTWGIAEPDLLSTIQGRLASMQTSGAIDRLQRDLAVQAEARVRRPAPVAGLTPATEPRRWSHDPAIVTQTDIRDQKGRLIAARGTRVNPLDFVTLRQDLVFLDGDDPAQVAWAMDTWRPAGAKIILVSGSPFDLMKAHQRRAFFDQRGSLTSKFGIAHTPAVVRVDGGLLAVEEVVLPRPNRSRDQT